MALLTDELRGRVERELSTGAALPLVCQRIAEERRSLEPVRWVKPSSRKTATPERQVDDGERDPLAEIIALAKRRRE